ncbi:hypothetical protein LCGC14_0388300 [marine sediment metagenome]|uniref:Uncharacterized protein n=1 Tax=marine sediment metagenome TaxID=412755 RepID=A0A0F9W972_9ZZZZ
MKEKKKIVCWMLLTKRGVPQILNGQLPIFWRKSIAQEKAKIFNCDIKRLELAL